MTLKELNTQLIAEKGKLQRLSEKLHATRAKLDGENAEISRIQTSIAKEQETAIFEERPWPSPEATGKLAAARARAHDATAAVHASEISVEKQCKIVSSIEGELAARRQEALLAAIAKPKKKFLVALRSLVEAGAELQEAIVTNGGIDRDGLFPPSVPSDPLADVLDRQELAAFFGAVLKLSVRAFYEGDAAVPYWLRQLE